MLALNWPTTGALNMMLRHARKESLNYKSLYTRSHPFFADRAKALQNHAQSKNIFPQELTRAFQKIKIKVIAFSSPLHTVDSVINDAPIDDAIKPYGRAIAAYRHGKTEKALRLIDDFEQKNGGKTKYTYELRSEILLTAGRAQQSLEAMNGALAVDPKNLNFVIQKAVILFHLKRFSEMITLLQPMLSTHAHKDALWYWLGLAYERTNNKGRMYVCLAERYALMQEWAKAKHYLVLSQKVLPKTDEFAQRRNDLIFHIKENKKGSKK
jgi:predicted Zn-dependent protease